MFDDRKMRYAVSQAFVKRLNIFSKAAAAAYVIGSVLALYSVYEILQKRMFFILLLFQVLWSVGLFIFFKKIFLGWRNAYVEVLENELLVRQKKETKVPFELISQVRIAINVRKEFFIRIKSGGLRRLVFVPPVEEASAFYAAFKAKLARRSNIDFRLRLPLEGVNLVMSRILIYAIFLTVCLRSFFFIAIVALRASSHIHYFALVLPLAAQFCVAGALVTNISRQSKVAYAVTILLGIVFAIGFLNVMQALRFQEIPAWYTASLWFYFGLIALGTLAAAFLLVKAPTESAILPESL